MRFRFRHGRIGFSLGAHVDFGRPHVNLYLGEYAVHLGLVKDRLFSWRPKWSPAYSVNRHEGKRLRIMEIAGPWFSVGFDRYPLGTTAIHLGWWIFIVWAKERK